MFFFCWFGMGIGGVGVGVVFLDRTGLDWIGLDVGIPPMVIARNAFCD
jgi:hypothetical protein